MDLTPTLRLNLPAFAYEPWDDEVNDNFDVLDAFVGSVVAFNNYAGIWMNATAYTLGQQVIDTADSSFWVCEVSHTSSVLPATFLTDRTNHPTYWLLKQNSAKQYAEQAASSAAAAAASAQAAQEAFEAIMPDAPRNGIMYGRIDGTWQQAVAIDSPFFTGDPRAPTPLLSDNDNSIATTAFVKGLVGTSAAFVSIGDLPPASPSIGSLWWDDIGGQLYVYYRDVDTYQWVAVNSATGGMGTGFMPIVGGTFTGPVTLSGAPTANLHAATKLYVDTKVSTATYPYLLLNGGSQTVVGPTTFSSTLTSGAHAVTGAISATDTITAASMLRSNNGRIMNWAPNYAPSVTLWRNDIGARGMWSDGNDIVFGQLDGAGTPVSGYGGWNTSNDFYATGTIWAAGLVGNFGLQNFGGGYWGIRFNSGGWRLQWSSANGALTFCNDASTSLFYCDPSGNISCNGSIYCPGQMQTGGRIYGGTGVAFGPQNGWEFSMYVDGSGNQITNHRGGWYEYWSTSGGASHWIKNNTEVMSLDGGNLWVAGNMTANSSMYAGYIQSNGNVHAVGTHTGAAVSVSGDVYGSACYHPNGVFAGGSGDTGYGFYRSGGDKIWQSVPNWYWRHQSDNTHFWVYNGTPFWVMYGPGGGAVNAWCINNIGPVGGQGAYGAFSDARLKTNVEDTHYGSAEIMKLRPKSFMRKKRHEDAPEPRKEIGFIAQEVRQVMPEAVIAGELDGEPTLIFTDAVVTAALVNAYKELSARVVALEARHGA